MALSTIIARDGNNAAIAVPAMADLAGNVASMVSLDSSQQVYRASASFTPQATAGVTVATLQGSASKTVRIRRVMLGGSATALSSTLFVLQRTSALGAGGTAVVPTIAKLDTNSATATAVAQVYTTTLKAAGTGVGGPLSSFQLFQTTVTTPTVAFNEQLVVFPERGVSIGQALVLRGAADFLEIQNGNGGNLAAGSILQVTFEWVEDNS